MLKVTHSNVRQVGTDSVSLCRICEETHAWAGDHVMPFEGRGGTGADCLGWGWGRQAGRNYKFKIVV